MMLQMRTTVTLDEDVASKLKRLAREREVSFKEALNSSLRRGLRSEEPVGQPYRVPTKRLEARAGINLDRALRLAGESEDEETLRKLALRK